RSGHKLSPAADPDKGPNFTGTRTQLNATAANLKMLTDLLTATLGRYVANETGLDGQYDFKLTWTPPDPKTATDPDASRSDTEASIFTALNEQLGLRLEGKKGPVPVLVVEKVERPAEN